MKQFFQKTYDILVGRLARNIYFWLFVFYSRISLDKPQFQNFIALVLFVWLMVVSYTNNFLLVPRLMARKKYVFYWLSFMALIFSVSFCYVFTLKLATHYHPKLEVFDVSIITDPKVTGVLTIKSTIAQMSSYTAVMFIWGCMFTMGWFVMDYARQQKLIETANRKQIETELIFLKSQINPHFLFNTLNNIYALSIKKSENTPNVILKLSSILRYLLYESDVEKVSFEKEKELMQAYIDLELLRLDNNNSLKFSITADGSYNIPPLLWLPILENVFKHGTRFIADKYFIEYNFNIQNKLLTIYSKNTYKEQAEKEKTDTSGGLGLSNLRKRLEILYPKKHKIQIGKDNNYYITEVEIQLS